MDLLALAQMEIPELEVVAEGEYKLVVNAATPTVFSTGRSGINLRLGIEGRDDTKTIFHSVCLPDQETDPPKTFNALATMFQAFWNAFSVQTEDVESWIGLSGWAFLRIENHPETQVPFNRVARFGASAKPAQDSAAPATG